MSLCAQSRATQRWYLCNNYTFKPRLQWLHDHLCVVPAIEKLMASIIGLSQKSCSASLRHSKSVAIGLRSPDAESITCSGHNTWLFWSVESQYTFNFPIITPIRKCTTWHVTVQPSPSTGHTCTQPYGEAVGTQWRGQDYQPPTEHRLHSPHHPVA